MEALQEAIEKIKLLEDIVKKQDKLIDLQKQRLQEQTDFLDYLIESFNDDNVLEVHK